MLFDLQIYSLLVRRYWEVERKAFVRIRDDRSRYGSGIPCRWMEDGANRLHADSLPWCISLSGSTVDQNQIKYTNGCMTTYWNDEVSPPLQFFRLVCVVAAAQKRRLLPVATALSLWQQGHTFVCIFFLDSLTLRDGVDRFCPKRRCVTNNNKNYY